MRHLTEHWEPQMFVLLLYFHKRRPCLSIRDVYGEPVGPFLFSLSFKVRQRQSVSCRLEQQMEQGWEETLPSLSRSGCLENTMSTGML